MNVPAGEQADWRKHSLRIVLYSCVHYGLLLILESVVFIVAHFPPKVIDLSNLVVGITYLQQALNVPRMLLRHLWLSEMTPGWLNILLLVVNSLVFGLAWYGWRKWRNRT